MIAPGSGTRHATTVSGCSQDSCWKDKVPGFAPGTVQDSLPAGLAPAPATAAARITTPIAATAAIATRAATAAESAPRGSRACFVDCQRPSMKVSAIHALDCVRRGLIVRHFHERKASGLAGVAITHNADAVHLPELAEGGFQILLHCGIGQVADVDILHSKMLSCSPGVRAIYLGK